MINNNNIRNYYNSKISDFRKKVCRGVIPRRDKAKVLRDLNKLSEIVNSNYTANQFNEMLDKIESLYSELQVDFNAKIKYLNLYFKKHRSFPAYSDKVTVFKDGTIMSEFIFEHLSYLEKLYSKNKVYLQNLSGYKLGKRQPPLITRKIVWPFEIKMRFVFRYLSEYNCLPIEYDINFKFPDGESVLEWIIKNKQVLNDSSDYRAKCILVYYDYYGNQVFQDKLDYVYDYLLEKGELPRTSDNKTRFSDGTLVSNWLYYNGEKIKQLKPFVQKAKIISDHLGDRKVKKLGRLNSNLSFDEKKLIVYNYLLENGALPKTTNKTLKFDDGVLISDWIVNYRDKLYALRNDDYQAKAIVNYLESSKTNGQGRKRNALNFDERITEVYEYLVESGCLPKYNDKTIRFSDSVIMGGWLKRNKNKIKEMVRDERITMIARYFDDTKLYRDTSSKQRAAVFEQTLINEKGGKVKKLDIK